VIRCGLKRIVVESGPEGAVLAFPIAGAIQVILKETVAPQNGDRDP